MKYLINLYRDGGWIVGWLCSEDGKRLGGMRSTSRDVVIDSLTKAGLTLLQNAGVTGNVVLHTDVESERT